MGRSAGNKIQEYGVRKYLENEVAERSAHSTAEDVRITCSFARAEKLLGREYHGRFLIELLQNAADASRGADESSKGSRVAVRITEGPALLVANEGTPMSAEVVIESLGHIGASISAWHKREGFSSPTEERLVREVMKGVRRKQGSSQKQAAPLTIGTLRRVLSAMRDWDPKTGKIRAAVLRDRALLLLGFAGSFRRDELSALKASDLEFFEGQGLVVLLRRSKTDVGGEGEAVGIPYGKHEDTCPVTNLERWLSLSGRSGEEALFCQIDRHGNMKTGGLSGDGINGVVKKRVQEAGLDPNRYSGHSLRAGLPTSASEAKIGMEAWMPHTRHKSVSVAMRYARRGTLFTNNPAAQVGL